MKRWYQHSFYSIGWLRLVFVVMQRTPRLVQPPIAAVTALIFFLLLGRERRAVAGNLRPVTGGGPELLWKVYKVFYSFCDLIVSYVFIPQASHAELLRMLPDDEIDTETIRHILAAGNGLIVWTAHLGNPEFASRLLELHNRPVNVARVVEDKPAEHMLRERMSNERLRTVDLRGGAHATIELLQALRRNEIVAIQGDRVYHPRHSVQATLFGRMALFPAAPFLLSQVSGAPVLPGFAVRRGWLRYRILMGQPIYPKNGENGDSEQSEALREAVRFLELQLAHYHDQWVNFFPFWPDHDRYGC